ncbi:MAG: HEAT repeat domain-containing protein [Candidatus Micrarchaeota archaeon]
MTTSTLTRPTQQTFKASLTFTMRNLPSKRERTEKENTFPKLFPLAEPKINTPERQEKLKQILSKLRNCSWGEAEKACNELTKIGTPQAVDELVRLLSHDSASTQQKALEELMVVRPTDCITFLQSNLNKAKKPKLRTGIILALAKLTDEVLPRLLEMSESSSTDVQLSAIEGLANFKNDRVIHVLFNKLVNSDSAVQDAAAIVLASMKPIKEIPSLLNHLDNKNNYIQHLALKVLGGFECSVLLELLSAPKPHRHRAKLVKLIGQNATQRDEEEHHLTQLFFSRLKQEKNEELGMPCLNQ